MAKKLLAVLLAVIMVVPMAISPAFADATGEKTYTDTVYCSAWNASNSEGYAALADGNYPMTPYIISTEFYLEEIDAGVPNGHGRITWSIEGHTFGYDAYDETIFVSTGGWGINDNTDFIEAVDYTLETGEYYRLTFAVRADHIYGYVNGELVLDAAAADLWAPGRYVVFWPINVDMCITETETVLVDGTVFQSGSGLDAMNGIDPIAGYTPGSIEDMSADGWEGVAPIYEEPVNYDFINADVVDAINAIGTVGYDVMTEVTNTGAAVFQFRNSGLDWVKKDFFGPASVEMNFAWTRNVDYQVNNKDEDILDENGNPVPGKQSIIGGSFGPANVYMGYNLDTQKFFIAKGCGSPYEGVDLDDEKNIWIKSEVYPLDMNKVYKMTLTFDKDRVAIALNGREVLYSSDYSYHDDNIQNDHGSHIFNMSCTNVDIVLTDFAITNLATGMAYAGANDWNNHVTNGEIKEKNYTYTAETYVDTYAAIAAAEAAYNKLSDDAKAHVANYQTLVDAKAAYVALAPTEKSDLVLAAEEAIAAIGEVTLDSAPAIAAARATFNKLIPYEKTLVANGAALAEAEAYYAALAPRLAAVEALIDDIGEIEYKVPNPQYPYEKDGYLSVFGDAAATVNGYATLEANGTTDLTSDYAVEFDFQYLGSSAGARFAGGGPNFNAGYNFDTKTWCISSGNPFGSPTPSEGSSSTKMTLHYGRVYTYKLEAFGNRITLYINGEKVAETRNIARKDGYFIFYPTYCTVNITNFSFWYFKEDHNEAPVVANLTGEAYMHTVNFTNRNPGAYFVEATKVVAPEFHDSLEYIEAAEAAVAALTDYELSQIKNIDVLAAARAEYDALAAEAEVKTATFTVDNVTVDADNIADYLVDDGSFVVPVSIKVSDLPKDGIAAGAFTVSVDGADATISEIKAGSAVADSEYFIIGPDGNNFEWAGVPAITDEDAELAVVYVAVPHAVAAGDEIAVSITLDEDADAYLTLGVDAYVPNVVDGGVTFAVNGAVATLEKSEAVAPTCEDEGSVEYWTDTVTGVKYADDAATAEIDDVVVPALGHALEYVEAKDPTYTEVGNTEYWYCPVCDKYFADAAATQEIALEDTVIPVLTAGDVNGDGVVNAKDVIAIMRYLAGWRDVEIDTKVADYNDDGKLNNRDVLLLLIDMANGVFD